MRHPRGGELPDPPDSKQQRVEAAVEGLVRTSPRGTPLRTPDIAREHHVSDETVVAVLKRFEDRGLVENYGRGPGRGYRTAGGAGRDLASTKDGIRELARKRGPGVRLTVDTVAGELNATKRLVRQGLRELAQDAESPIKRGFRGYETVRVSSPPAPDAEQLKWLMIREAVGTLAAEGDEDERLTDTRNLAAHYNVDPADLRSHVLDPLTEEGRLKKVGPGQDYAIARGPERPPEPAERQAPATPEDVAAAPPEETVAADTRWPTVLDEIVAAAREPRDELPVWDDYGRTTDDAGGPSEPDAARLREPGERRDPAEPAEEPRQPEDEDRRWDVRPPADHLDDPDDLDGPS
jgi:hypothetical protein